MARARRPRIKDVASAAGVSETTVSIVLNNRVGENVRVSEATQRKIWDAVRDLGYVANPVAQNLARGQNRIIAVFTFESIFPIDASSFYYPFLIGIEQAADQQGYDLLLVTGTLNNNSNKRSIYHNGFNRLSRADGAILLGHGNRKEIQRLIDEGFPFVYVGKREEPDGISYVAADYINATIKIVNYLFEKGHNRIAYMRSNRHNEASNDRELGFRLAYEQAGLFLEEACIWSGSAADMVSDVFTQYRAAGITAFVAEDDAIGRYLLDIAKGQGLSCPNDFSLAVLGNPLNPIQDVPDWTTFSIPRQQMGHEALEMLVDMLRLPIEQRETPYRKTLDCTFGQGQTVCLI